MASGERPQIRAVFIDLDGTLLDPDLRLPDVTRRAMEAARAAAVHIVLATGRPFSSASSFASTDGGEDVLIVSNGSAVVQSLSRRILWSGRIAEKTIRVALDLTDDLGLGLCSYDPLRWYSAGRDDLVEIEANRSGTKPAGPMALQGRQDGPIKLLLVGPPPILEKAKARLAETEQDAAYWFHTYPEYLEVMPRDVSKGQAVARVLSHLSVQPAEAMAIGDGDNDREMLSGVGVKVAVANASPGLKAIADFIAPSNAADGVGTALRAFVFRDAVALGQLAPTRREHV